jgi:hypothetical protein
MTQQHVVATRSQDHAVHGEEPDVSPRQAAQEVAMPLPKRAHATLLTHCGATRVSRQELVTFNPPARTATWTPVKHSDLVDALHAELDHRGLQVRHEHYAVQKQGAMLFGTLDLDWHDTGEYAAAIGLRTANDKSMALQLAMGIRVMVCDNLCFSGDLIALKRKHTAKLDLPREIAGALDRYQEGIPRLTQGITTLKTSLYTVSQAKEMVFDIFRHRILPVRFFHPVVHAYQAAVKEHGPTGWTLHNAFTAHIKTLPPSPAFRATVRLGKFFGLK